MANLRMFLPLHGHAMQCCSPWQHAIPRYISFPLMLLLLFACLEREKEREKDREREREKEREGGSGRRESREKREKERVSETGSHPSLLQAKMTSSAQLRLWNRQ